ncbi:MAG TPA: ThiF family adenylyltransferase [Planctomycetaceae bacterium]|nr:ThiF family adenylyltransferase [Planctomycetaceae bacterium]HIQ22165.1 ThiF family adenylyltransferase [Planctomycetota bacterium]
MSERVAGVGGVAEGRFARFELISWWDQSRLARARILLVGVGALGNEILKNLALLGVGHVLLVDLDRVEHSNLSRSILFRPEDCGQFKAEIAARRAREIYPEMCVRPICGNALYDLGLGPYRWADVVMAGLDNREARVAINRAAARAGKVWIDGAIERLDGVARVFHPATGPCYECTMSELDWKILASRRSCALLTREEMEAGKVPTTPTTASVVAAVQCQEAVKWIHGLETLAGRGFVFEGTSHRSHAVTYTRRDDCPSHEVDEPVEALPWRAAEARVGDLLERVRSDLGPDAVVETNNDLLGALHCPRCDRTEQLWTSLGKVTEPQARCPRCGADRTPRLVHLIDGKDPILDRSLLDIGIPPWDVVAGRSGMNQRFYELAGDREEVLGPEME